MRVEQQANLIEQTDLRVGVDTLVHTEVATANEQAGLYVNMENSNFGNVSSTNVLKGLFSSCTTFEDVMANAEALDVENLKNQMAVLSNVMTPEDYQSMLEEGFDGQSAPLETIVTVTDKIKMALLEAGVDVSDWGGRAPSQREIEAAGGSTYEIMSLQSALVELDLPLTKENISDGEKALNLAKDLTPLTLSQEKYMLREQLEPTIQNLYKVAHGVGETLQPKMEPETLENLRPQMEEILRESTYCDNPQGLEKAAWIVANDLPLTVDNLDKLQVLENLTLPPTTEEVAKAAAQAVADGLRPQDGNLSGELSLRERAKQAYDVIQQVGETQVDRVLSKGEPLTIDTLQSAMKEGKNGEEANAQERQMSYRRLEETRLMMTVRANYALLKQGISIETAPLTELVDALREAEEQSTQQLLQQAGLEGTPEEVKNYRETRDTLDAVKTAPEYVLGMRPFPEITLHTMRMDALTIETTLSNEQTSEAMRRYETVMTSPRADLGDRIQTAFRNVDAILEDMRLEPTAANQRAVRILGYNHLEITPESIGRMKAADAQVQTLLREMTPEITMHVIRKGLNPLDVTIGTLNQEIEKIQQENGYDDTTKEAEYLWKLEQHHEISEEERKAYIGVYRLFSQITQSDGAVIGALVEQGAPLTMRNLLTSVKNHSAKGIDITIDESFGGLEERTFEKETIDAQLARGFVQASDMRTYVEETTQYVKDLAKEAQGLTTPERVNVLLEQGLGEQTLEQVVEEMRAETKDAYQEAYVESQYRGLMEATATEEEVIQLLQANDTPVSYTHLLAAGNFLHRRNHLYRELREQADADDAISFDAIKEELIEKMGEAAKAPEEMAKAQEKLAELAEKVADSMLPPEHTLTHSELQNLKLMRTEIQLNTRMAQREQYAIPVLVADELGTMHLQIVRNDEEKGRVNIVFETENMGKLAAELSDLGSRIEGMVLTDNAQTATWIAQEKTVLEELFSQAGKPADISVVTEKQLDLTAFEMRDRTHQLLQRNMQENDASESYQVQTQSLYRMAKTFIETISRYGA